MADNIITGAMLKALDDLSLKLLVPITVLAISVDYADKVIADIGTSNFWLVYLSCFILGVILSFFAGILFEILNSYWTDLLWGELIDFGKVLSIFLIPLGVMGIAPSYFSTLQPEIPFATGVALLVWGFALATDVD